ncbi:uncharacterized protein J3D65DRAFT_641626 [Phyllosticta citribraziliensis]|uniref:Uncharacterized protein n=1 Tax=Phyllosticta citribraziliensis TaxID=989973 RepID=A0ABR1L5G7_9PEZI
MTSPTQSNFNLAIKARCEAAWQKCREGDEETGWRMARRILLESRLGDFHRANMNLLLTKSDDHAVEHGQEAVATYKRLIESAVLDHHGDLVAFFEKMHDQAHRWLKKAQEHEDEEKRRLRGMPDSQIQTAIIKDAMKQCDEEGDEEGGGLSRMSIGEQGGPSG